MNAAHIDKIRSRGYWRVVIRPTTFLKKRVENILDLPRILEACAVRLRGWDYPHIDSKVDPEIGPDWVSQSVDWENFVEYWRFYQSGQFIHLDSFKEDWMDQRRIFGSGDQWVQGDRLLVASAVFSFTEVFELAARLSMSKAGGEATHIDIALHGLSGRQLWLDPSRWHPFPGIQKASVSEFRFQQEYSKGELTGSAWSLALEPTTELFRRFGWDPPSQILEKMQQSLREWRQGR